MIRAGGGAGQWARGMAAVALVALALGLPIVTLPSFLLLVLAAIVIATGRVSRHWPAWAGAAAVAAVAILFSQLWPSPKIEEGHNVFLAGAPGRVLERDLPEPVYRFMADRFDAAYPMEGRCSPAPQCWDEQPGPSRVYAFSGDALLDAPAYSRRLSALDLQNPVWHRIGALNEMAYNWSSGIGNLQRLTSNRGLGRLTDPWHVDMPYFVMVRLPQAYIGSQFCWTGDVLWENPNGTFSRQITAAFPLCRILTEQDIERRIYGIAIGKEQALSMRVVPSWSVWLWGMLDRVMALAAAGAILLLLVRVRFRAMRLPLILTGLGLAVVALSDIAMLGGWRPFDGGDDGLFYEGVGRQIAQHWRAGEWMLALRGGEDVYYYGGPGLRYFIALERFVFGDTHFGYLALLLVFPWIVFVLFDRLFTRRVALLLTLVFVAIPIGGLFGTAYYQYVKWAARGFADPAAYIAFIAGLMLLVDRPLGAPRDRFAPACAAALMFAIALWMRPIVAPAVAVLLAAAGLAALWHRCGWRVAGLCTGFLPALGMALHNWTFGGVFVLFSGNAGHPQVFVTPPGVYGAALREIVTLQGDVPHLKRVAVQVMDWLSGPSESWGAVPLHALAVAVLVRVALARRFAGWIRVIAGAALAQHLVGLTHVLTARYYYAAWFLTLLVVLAWLRDEGWPALLRRSPRARAMDATMRRHIDPAADRWMRWAGLARRRPISAAA